MPDESVVHGKPGCNQSVPLIGLLFCGNSQAYAYILESLRNYPAQLAVAEKMLELKLANVAPVLSPHDAEACSPLEANCSRLACQRPIDRGATDLQRLGDGKRPHQPSTPWCFDSLGDLNFMEEHLIVIWTIRRVGCWIIGG